MCDPVTALTVATVASGVTGFIGQQQAASAQEAANMQSRNLAIQNQNLQIRALRNQEEEDAVQASQALQDSAREAAALRARATVAAGESGVSGLSIDALMGDIVRQETENRLNILQTQDFRQRQRQLDREGLGITTQSQINQLPAVQYPSFLEAVASTGSAAYGVYQRGQATRTPRDTIIWNDGGTTPIY